MRSLLVKCPEYQSEQCCIPEAAMPTSLVLLVDLTVADAVVGDLT